MNFSTLFTHCPVCGDTNFKLKSEKSKSCNKCGFVYFMNASAAVAAFIVNKEGELLVCKRAKEPEKGTLDLPGGFVDDNETAEEAISREISEELQVNAITTEYLFSLPNTYLYSRLTIPTLDLFFRCDVDDTTKIIPTDDVEACFFIKIEDIDPSQFGLKSIKKAVSIFKLQHNK